MASVIVTRKRSHMASVTAEMDNLAALSADSDDDATPQRSGRGMSSPRKMASSFFNDDSDASRRAGKWTADEDNLANQLVTDFENGSLDDCEDGTTLRSYLARKLNCQPMRISKKFAGRCIGKVQK